MRNWYYILKLYYIWLLDYMYMYQNNEIWMYPKTSLTIMEMSRLF